MSNFTLDELAQFSQEEKELRKILQDEPDLPEIEYAPSDLSVRLILNYAKVLSVRDTQKHGQVEMILN